MASSPIPISEGRRGLLDRALSIFTQVKAGEGFTVLLLALNVFLVMASYYILKPVREALILTELGEEVKAYLYAGTAVILLVLVPAYGGFASRVNRIRLITWVTLFFISHLGIFYLLGVAGVQVGAAFFIWVSIFSVIVVAQIWAFANDLFTEEQGKRLFPIVGVGSGLGAWLGAEMASWLFGQFDPAAAPYSLMLVAAAGFGVGIAISHGVHRREQARATPERASAAEKPLGKEGGFKLVFTQRYLLLMALAVLLLNVVNTTGGFLLDKVVTASVEQQTADIAEQQVLLGQFYGNFFGSVNLLGFLLQLFLVSRIFKYIGVRGALFILPCLALGSYGLMIATPILGVIRLVKMLENSTDYSINNTARHALFLLTSREAKYKAKVAIDTFFWRVGDMLSAGVVFLGVQLAFGIQSFAIANVIFTLIWIAIVVAIVREHKRLSSEVSLSKAA
ncbi:MAG: translocase [Acidobacteria bacterium]|nr:translocase [Acidobacteriota bacterium]